MALMIHVGLTRKLGTANYGSIAASCAVEFEADAALLQGEPAGFQQRAAKAYAACRQAVQQELARQQQAGAAFLGQADGRNPAANADRQDGNGQAASEKQMLYLRQLAAQTPGLGLRGLETLAQKMFDKPLAALGGLEASNLIDTLKSVKTGELELAALLDG